MLSDTVVGDEGTGPFADRSGDRLRSLFNQCFVVAKLCKLCCRVIELFTQGGCLIFVQARLLPRLGDQCFQLSIVVVKFRKLVLQFERFVRDLLLLRLLLLRIGLLGRERILRAAANQGDDADSNGTHARDPSHGVLLNRNGGQRQKIDKGWDSSGERTPSQERFSHS